MNIPTTPQHYPTRYICHINHHLVFCVFLITFVKPMLRNMNNRLTQFLAAENISQSQFADTIEVARASVSHIIAGRNKPGWDFLNSMLKHYPNLNIEWLLNGTGKMYKSSARETANESSKNQTQEITDLFSSAEVANEPVNAETSDISTPRESKISDSSSTRAGLLHQENAQNTSSIGADSGQRIDSQRKISKIVVFYDDNTFSEIL